VTDPPSLSTLPTDDQTVRPRRIGYAITTALLTAAIGLTVLDGVTPLALIGVDSATTTARGPGFELSVTYGEVSRPALATPFDIRVVQPGGFDGPIRIAVDQEYLRMWDENGLVPAPAEEGLVGDQLVWEFDPPPGNTLFVSYDARIEPAAQDGRSGSVAVLDEDDAVLAEVEFTTRIMP
jgi:hypothetical protein